MHSQLVNILKSCKGRIKICGHKNIDADSLLSILLLEDFFEYLGFQGDAVIPDNVTEEQPLMTAKALSIDIGSISKDISGNDLVFLVDCHSTEFSDNVIGCIDHHPTSEKISFPFCLNRRASSAAMLIIRMMEESGMRCTEKHYKYAVYSAYLDTLALKSIKTDKGDIPWLEDKIQRFNIDRRSLMRLGLGLNDQNRPVDKLALIGYKEYLIRGI